MIQEFNSSKTQKIYRPLVEGIIVILKSIFIENKYADKSIEFHFRKNSKWGSRDRKFVARITYESVRWWRKYYSQLDLEEDCAEWQDNDWQNIVGLALVSDGILLPPWWPKHVHSQQQLEALIHKKLDTAIEQSYPDWISEEASRQIGENWESLAKVLNEEAPVFLRTNLLKLKPEKLQKELEEEGIKTDILSPQKTDWPRETLKLKERGNVFRTQAFKKGWFEVQDWGSQQLITFLNPQSGDRVIDACAGAGGKTLQMASHMDNKGKIIAMDVHDWKLKELRKRSSRNGIDIIETRHIQSSKDIKRLHGKCDKLLLDVPCSGMGVLRRNPDSKWKLTPARLKELEETQSEIISSYSKMVKHGGQMMYATCSLFPSENQEIVAKFLEGNSSWKLEKEEVLKPSSGGGDGFYLALLQNVSQGET